MSHDDCLGAIPKNYIDNCVQSLLIYIISYSVPSFVLKGIVSILENVTLGRFFNFFFPSLKFDKCILAAFFIGLNSLSCPRERDQVLSFVLEELISILKKVTLRSVSISQGLGFVP